MSVIWFKKVYLCTYYFETESYVAQAGPALPCSDRLAFISAELGLRVGTTSLGVCRARDEIQGRHILGKGSVH